MVAPLWVAAPVAAQSIDELKSMSIEQLANVDVTSVTKSAGALSAAPGSIHVITHDDIARAGVTTVPEALRLAPNLQVARRGAADWVITARGMSGNAGAQNFPNKLLVLIDGRSVYTPLYSGVYWDMQDIVLADVDRIEVISGPGATLWGANAVNGVINIITRNAAQTHGLLVDVTAGDQEQTASLRYGGAIGNNAHYRVYLKGVRDEAFADATGGSALDQWRRLQGGFRIDWTPSPRDDVMVRGDAYAGTTGHPGNDERISGRSVTAHWRHATGASDDGGALQVQLFYERTMRADATTGRLAFDSYDVDVQHDFLWGQAQHIVWGGGARVSHYLIDSIAGLSFSPPRRTLFLGNLFVQDSIAIGKAVTLVIGAKAEDDPYAGVSFLPSVRGSVKLGGGATLWAAASRAIRSPTPFDRDVVETVGGAVLLTGDANFRTEKLTAYEAGLRSRLGRLASFSVSGFYNVYDDLRSIELTPVTGLPLRWGNRINAQSWGVEAEATVKPAPWWQLTAGYSFLHQRVTFDPDASRLLGTAQIGDDPHHQASLRSAIDLGPVTLDGALRHVGQRPDPVVPAYTEADARIGWRVSRRLMLSVTGNNLLHRWHIEYAGGERVPRSVLFGLRWQ
ncbi:MAG: TonB-dependent receptor plug [Sphingomonas bacterium]|uniref:TonB-dependent receptor plug domain-containing protein n=1 Tax=Sphingomonas bacterium TaxID=1895847 RepID=UPI002608ECA2|nr:TonB-dependent receptor [Sphingomonas bacterium]MDB5708512.1 TonB-dependent receptor plug [Sphingomonas bacterium]